MIWFNNNLIISHYCCFFHSRSPNSICLPPSPPNLPFPLPPLPPPSLLHTPPTPARIHDHVSPDSTSYPAVSCKSNNCWSPWLHCITQPLLHLQPWYLVRVTHVSVLLELVSEEFPDGEDFVVLSGGSGTYSTILGTILRQSRKMSRTERVSIIGNVDYNNNL